MVISVETTLLHPRRGFIKLEDTTVVTDAGYEVPRLAPRRHRVIAVGI
jgi:Xaa-Pro aminopeptidase